MADTKITALPAATSVLDTDYVPIVHDPGGTPATQHATVDQVRTLDTDAQHGNRGGGALHATVIASGAAGFMSGSDKSKLDGLPSSAAPTTRTISAGNGLSGGGDLSADRTFTVAANADGSISVGAGGVQVGVLATDAQHGNRGGGAIHSVATGSTAGFMSAADKSKLDSLSSSSIDMTVQGLRLSVVSATPITSSDQTAKSTLYFTPYKSGAIALYDGVSSWVIRTTAEISLALSALTSGKNYDVFAYWTGSAVALEISTAWTNDTTRADALARQDGVYVKSADHTRRLVGTIRTTGTTTTEDSSAKRFVWNVDNQLPQYMKIVEATSSWSYATNTWRAANNSAANCFEYVCGDVHWLDAESTSWADASTAAVSFAAGVGIDSTSTNSAILMGGATRGTGQGATVARGAYRGRQASGYHKITWLEISNSGVSSFYGTAGHSSYTQTGMVGTVWG